MMGYGNMMGWGWGAGMTWLGFFGVIFWLVLLFDLILVGIWLWQQIQKDTKR